MAQPQRLLLADIGARAGLEPRRLQHLERFAALLHHRLQIEGDGEMILDRGLVAAGHENNLLDPRMDRRVDRVLDQRPSNEDRKSTSLNSSHQCASRMPTTT